jgi:REP element-mobilizing transposase RayT
MADLYKNKYRIPTARATWHDYNGGSYFVTMCTKNRECYFGHISNGEMGYSDLGQSAIYCLEQIPAHFPHVEIPVFIVMPNHIHAIIIINALDPNMVETQNFASLHNETKQKFGPQSKNLASVVRGFKIGVTKYANDQDFSFAWQPRFHDHIIRNHNEMDHIADYIENNIILWKEDCYNGLRSQPISNNPEKPYLKFF